MLIVFSDLDATLLDHHDYSWDAARPALERLRRLGVPVVLVTSKTAAEVLPLWRDIDLDGPFIVENGGGLFLPPGFPAAAGAEARDGFAVLTLGAPYAELRRFVEHEAGDLGVRGFGDMTTREVMAVTDLPQDSAERARRREFTEPFLLPDPAALPELERRASARGLAVTSGGRFYHLLAAGHHKGRAVDRAADLLRRAAGAGEDELLTVGLGDSPNDREMLEAVDRAVVIPHPDRPPLELERSAGVVRAAAPGPRGWNAAIHDLLDELGLE